MFTLNVLKYLSFNTNSIQNDLCEIIDKCFVDSKHLGYSEEDKLRLEVEVKEFAKSKLTFPKVKDTIMSVPEEFINAYINTIKACANNVFEYNIRVNPDAKIDSPLVVPDDEYNPLLHSASKNIDNPNAVLMGEFTVDYDTAKGLCKQVEA